MPLIHRTQVLDARRRVLLEARSLEPPGDETALPMVETCRRFGLGNPAGVVTASGMACRGCGCTDDDACMTLAGPCYWTDGDLCSACKAKGERNGEPQDAGRGPVASLLRP